MHTYMLRTPTTPASALNHTLSARIRSLLFLSLLWCGVVVVLRPSVGVAGIRLPVVGLAAAARRASATPSAGSQTPYLGVLCTICIPLSRARARDRDIPAIGHNPKSLDT